jgi:predicted transcriptional regulator
VERLRARRAAQEHKQRLLRAQLAAERNHREAVALAAEASTDTTTRVGATGRAIIQHLALHPGHTTNQVAHHLGLTHIATSKAIKRLATAGVVTNTTPGCGRGNVAHWAVTGTTREAA